MIIGTAGHIDHGKTSLVKALTGVDTDRLAEEKARGITIDLGFAYQSLADGSTLGFVDVPGHEKLVRNMLAGATGIDHVLLVVAADDGPMPQTREHLAIVDLLGLRHGAVVLTKADLVGPDRLAAATAEVRALLAPTGLAAAPVIAVSSTTGLGLDALREHLQRAAGTAAAVQAQVPISGHFRLAVDRVFSLAGVGTVATGTAVAGSVRVGDRLVVSPRGLSVRVRGLHAQSHAAETGHAGQRLALNLAGVERADVQRGDWVVAEAAHAPTRRLDVRLHLLASEARALAHWTPLHLHLGATDVLARAVPLDMRSVPPGGQALVQLELDREIGALRGDRFVVRDQSALRTLGGGWVVDPFAQAQRRRRPAYRSALAALEAATPDSSLAALLAARPPEGVDIALFATRWNLLPAAVEALQEAVPHRKLHEPRPSQRVWLFAPGHLESLAERLVALLTAHHRARVDSPGLSAEQLQRALAGQLEAAARPPTATFALLLGDMARAGTLRRQGAHWCLPEHEVALLPAEQKLWERIRPWLDEGGMAPPKVSDMLARDRTLPREALLRVLTKLQRMGRVHAVGAEYFIQARHMALLAAHARELADADPDKRLNVKALRDATGMSRHLSVPLVEFFDAVGFTQRDAVGRHVRAAARSLFDAAP